MLQKPGCLNKNKIIWLVFICWVVVACYPLATTPSPRTITKTLEPTSDMILIPSGDTKKTPIVTSTPLLTPVVQSLPTLDLQAWNDKANQYGSIVLIDKDESNILLFSPNSEFQKNYQLTNEIYPLKVEQVIDNCSLIILVDSIGGHKLIQISQNGEIEQEIFSLESDRPNTPMYMPILSQTRKYVAYVVFSGELYYDTAQNQDIEVVELSHTNRPIRVTSHGGAWKEGGAWSLDGTQIAYTDYDDNGVLQVYITQIVGGITKKVLTQFKDSEVKAGPISWSPSGEQLAVILEDRDHKNNMWIVPTQDNPAFKLDLPNGKFPIADNFFWSDDGSRMLLYIGNNLDSSDMAGLYWFDIKNNKLLHVLTPKDASQIVPEADSFAYIFPLTIDLSKVVFYNSKDKWYLYDMTHQQIENVSWLNNRDWGSHVDISLFSKNIATCTP
jgi:Tol biopolymer transport system component